MRTILERTALYDAVWTEPATVVADRYGITSTALAKICRKLGVPTPPRGHWAKAAAGQRVARAPLPPARAGRPTTHALDVAPPPPAHVVASLAEERGLPPIVVPANVSKLHPLLQHYAPRLRQRGERDDLWRNDDCIAIRVSRDSVERALRIMHALLVALDERGLPVEVAAPDLHASRRIESRTLVTVGQSHIAIGIDEMYRTEAPPPPRPQREMTSVAQRMEELVRRWETKRVPTGQLRLWLDPETFLHTAARRQVRDTDHQRVEDLLNKFVAQLHVFAELARERREAEAAQRLQWAELERARELEAQRRAREERLSRDLAERSATLAQIHEMRSLVAAVSSRPATPSTNAWLAWAQNRIDAIERAALSVDAEWERLL